MACVSQCKIICTTQGFNFILASKLNFAPYETIHHKGEETRYMEPDAEINLPDTIDKMMEADISVCEKDETLNLHIEKDFNLHEIHANNTEPYIGMEFDSEEAAMAYYDAYAKHVGFIIRIGSSHRSRHDGSVISRRFLCNREGFRVNKKGKRVEERKPRLVTRDGCKAMIMVRKEISGRWVVAKIETRHSHPLGISIRKVRRGSIPPRSQDDKDKRIRDLSTELQRTKLQLAECQRQLHMVLNDVELHLGDMNRSVKDIIQNVKKVEDEHPRQF